MQDTNTFIHAFDALPGWMRLAGERGQPRIKFSLPSDALANRRTECTPSLLNPAHEFSPTAFSGFMLIRVCVPDVCAIGGISRVVVRPVKSHGSSLVCSVDQLRPDGFPVVGAKVLQGCAWVVLVPAPCKNRANNLELPQHLIDVLLVNYQVLGDFPAAFWCVVWKGHTAYSSYGLAFVKPVARFIF